MKFPTIYHGVDLGNVNPSKVVDVEQCPLATKGINEALPQAREDARKRVGDAFASGDGKRLGKRGATLLFRETTEEGTVTDNNAHVSERVNGMVFNFKVSKTCCVVLSGLFLPAFLAGFGFRWRAVVVACLFSVYAFVGGECGVRALVPGTLVFIFLGDAKIPQKIGSEFVVHCSLGISFGAMYSVSHVNSAPLTMPAPSFCHSFLPRVHDGKAGEFFQNNPYVLPHMVDYVVARAREGGAKNLIDAYCGGGLFCLSASTSFEKCAGIEISPMAVDCATRNAATNEIS